MEEYNLYSMDQCRHTTLGTTTRISLMETEKVKVVELTMEDGTKIIRRGGEEAVYRAWSTYPIVSAKWTGEEETMQWASEDEIN